MSTTPKGSEELLTEIMLLLRDLNKETKKNSESIRDLSKSVKDLDDKLNALISDAFVDGDVKAHGEWHRNNNKKGFLARILRR